MVVKVLMDRMAVMSLMALIALMAVMTAITVNSEYAKWYELSVIPDMLDTAEVKVYEWP